MTDPSTETIPRRPLIIGYGNSLRQDDGAGWLVAHQVAEDPRAIGCDVIAAHQLTPELAEDLHHASVAVLVDAAVDVPPGHWRVSRLDPSARCPGSASSHGCSPEALIALANSLYGRVAPVTLIRIGAASLGEGDGLTGTVAAAVPPVADLAIHIALAEVDHPARWP